MVNIISKIKGLFFPKLKTRKELKFVSYSDAEELIKNSWTIAKEEDSNHQIGFVYLELLEESIPSVKKN